MGMPTSAAGWAARGYPCRKPGCEGHIRGWEFAEQYNITDEEYANGNSESFNEGVRAYAEEQAEIAEGLVSAAEAAGGGMVKVAGYFRSSGTYVNPYYRRRPGQGG